MQPKLKFEIVVSSEEWEEKTITAIEEAAFTGMPGDGKIFTYEIRQAKKIRTKETGYDVENIRGNDKEQDFLPNAHPAEDEKEV